MVATLKPNLRFYLWQTDKMASFSEDD